MENSFGSNALAENEASQFYHSVGASFQGPRPTAAGSLEIQEEAQRYKKLSNSNKPLLHKQAIVA
jgi:hypothetical protein